jgi:hypothetical protein
VLGLGVLGLLRLLGAFLVLPRYRVIIYYAHQHSGVGTPGKKTSHAIMWWRKIAKVVGCPTARRSRAHRGRGRYSVGFTGRFLRRFQSNHLFNPFSHVPQLTHGLGLSRVAAAFLPSQFAYNRKNPDLNNRFRRIRHYFLVVTHRISSRNNRWLRIAVRRSSVVTFRKFPNSFADYSTPCFPP